MVLGDQKRSQTAWRYAWSLEAVRRNEYYTDGQPQTDTAHGDPPGCAQRITTAGVRPASPRRYVYNDRLLPPLPSPPSSVRPLADNDLPTAYGPGVQRPEKSRPHTFTVLGDQTESTYQWRGIEQHDLCSLSLSTTNPVYQDRDKR